MKTGLSILAVSLCLGGLVAVGCGPTEVPREDSFQTVPQRAVARMDAGIDVPDAGSNPADAGADAGTGAGDGGVADAGTPQVCPAPTSTTAVLNDFDLSYYPWSEDPGGLVTLPPDDLEFPSIEEALQNLGVDPRKLVTPEGNTCYTVLNDEGLEQTVCPDPDTQLLWDIDFAATQLKKGETKATPPPGGGTDARDGGVGGGGDGGTPPTQNCCLCTYQYIPGCVQWDKDTCGTKKDCMWADRGVCIGRFQEQCNDWVKQQQAGGWCTRYANVGEPATGNEFPAGTCKSFRLQRYGHSNYPSGCTAIQNAVRVCVNTQPTCGEFDVNYDGCWTFKDVAGAYGYMQRIVPTLGGDQCVKVSANQCLASTACQTRYNFTITSKGVCHEKPGACNFGGFCYGGLSKDCYPNGDHGKVSLCSTDNGIKSQVCCCDSVDANGVRKDCKFKEGRTCN